jgi:hypothetical protein
MEYIRDVSGVYEENNLPLELMLHDYRSSRQGSWPAMESVEPETVFRKTEAKAARERYRYGVVESSDSRRPSVERFQDPRYQSAALDPRSTPACVT